jgi:hypothetical protein
MAELATPSAATMFDGGAPEKTKDASVKPSKPDEAEYKKNLAKADKELKDAQAKFVCTLL